MQSQMVVDPLMGVLFWASFMQAIKVLTWVPGARWAGGAHGGQAGPTRGVRAVSTAAGISTLAAVVGSVA